MIRFENKLYNPVLCAFCGLTLPRHLPNCQAPQILEMVNKCNGYERKLNTIKNWAVAGAVIMTAFVVIF